MAVTTMVGLFVGLLLSLFRYGTVLAIDTNTTDNNIVINEMYYPRGDRITTAVVHDCCDLICNIIAVLAAPAIAIAAVTNNNERELGTKVPYQLIIVLKEEKEKEKERQQQSCFCFNFVVLFVWQEQVNTNVLCSS